MAEKVSYWQFKSDGWVKWTLQFLYKKYQPGKSNKVADALSHCLHLDNEESSDASSEEYDTVSYTTICEDITNAINGENLPTESKQKINNDGENMESIPVMTWVIMFNNIIVVLGKITPEDMLITKHKDVEIGNVIRCVKLF